MTDDRVRCTDCAELTPLATCRAARERRRLDVGPKYAPVLDLLRRCEFFRAKRGADDQRRGAERWPWMFAEYQARVASARAPP